jgi:hypothetical protein
MSEHVKLHGGKPIPTSNPFGNAELRPTASSNFLSTLLARARTIAARVHEAPIGR